MNQEKDFFERNKPSDRGKRNDPHRREESAQRPGVSTYSSSDTDHQNENLTKTTSDNFDTGTEFGKGADPRFDEVDKENE